MLDLWYVRPIIVCDTCFCHYHEEFELYYDTLLEFGKTNWLNSHLHPQYANSNLKFYVREITMNYFTIRNVPMGKHYDRCANIGLFHNKYPIDKDQSLSNVTTD